MRILYLGSFRLPHGDAASARVLNVAKSLRFLGNDVSFISWGGKNNPDEEGADAVCRVDGFPFQVTNEIDFQGSIINKTKAWLLQGNKTKKLLRETYGEYDVVISYNCSIIGWLKRFCKKHHLFLISDLTEWYALKELSIIGIPGYLWKMKVLQKRVPNKIVISSFLNNYYHDTHNIIIPATCDATDEKWKQGDAFAIEKVGAFDGKTLVYAGTPGRKDAIHIAINSIQLLIEEGHRIRLIIVGITRESYLCKYKGYLHKPILSEWIQFVEKVPQQQVPSFYELADFMILLRKPTRKSTAGFPTKFTESFISGTPVIANLTSDIGLYLIDGETGFVVQAPNEEAFSQVIKEKVIPLGKADIEAMKQNVLSKAQVFDYHSYSKSLSQYMDELKMI